MKKVFLSCAAFLALTAQAQDSKIYVDMGTRGHDVAKSMYGMFFEEINHAGDGGLYGELLQNRGFEEHVLPGGMTYKEVDGQGRAYAPHALNYYGLDYVDSWVEWNIAEKKMLGWKTKATGCTLKKDVIDLTDNTPLHENTPNAMHIDITNAADGALAEVINTGYWGVPAKTGAQYKLRFYLRTSDYAGKVTARLCDKTGNSIGDMSFDVTADGQWKEYTGTLTAGATMSDGTFKLLFGGNGSIDIDYVSLFPTDTYKGRENGMRRDIAETLEGLRPNFLRWPGGCIVEGITLENRVKWKETIGDPMTRRGEFSLWGYRSTYGLGMYEFLQFCEDMNMDGMFVANLGLSCCLRNGDFVPADDKEALQPYLQDIIDAIEYAIGDPETNEWAKKRADAGHPKPFPLKYVELGNENGTQRYTDRWEFFYNTLKEKYPNIKFITSLTYWETEPIKHNVDISDTHWYVTPDEFYDRATLFDDLPRNGYEVYAGEYAANNGVGTGNMDAALSEAVFMGGMERNSDYVTMTSYAPLLTNVKQPNWSCNLIHFDTDRIMGRASYYVQKLYSENRPDYNVKTHLYSQEQDLPSFGRIGFGTWNTSAEFRNLKVTSNDGTRTLYTADFAAEPNHWTESGGTWTITDDNTWQQNGGGTPCVNVLNAYDFQNCTVELEARKIDGAEGFLLLFGGSNDNPLTHYRVNIGGWGNTQVAIEKAVNGGGEVKSDKTPFTIKTGQWYKLKLVMEEGVSVRCYIDDALVATLETGDLFNGRLQAFGGYDETAGEIVVKVVNARNTEMTSDITVNGRNIQSEGRVTTLSAGSLTDENTLDNPTMIYPEESTFSGFAGTFSYTFKPNSLTIFRIKADGKADAALDIPAYDYSDEPVTLDTADKELAAARRNLGNIIATANRLMVDGAAGTADLQEAVSAAQSVLDNGKATTKATNEQCTALETALTAYVKGLMTPANDYTAHIKDADFKNNSGWENHLPALEHEVGEFFNCNFDMYQTLTGLKPGTYLLNCQGFYRQGGIDVASPAHNDGTESLNAIMYANGASTPLHSLYDYKFDFGIDGYPNNRFDANKAFSESEEKYANYLIAEVGEDGTLRLGLKKETTVVWDWTCFDNFRLFYIPQTTSAELSFATKNNDGYYATFSNDKAVVFTTDVVASTANVEDGTKIMLYDLTTGDYDVNGNGTVKGYYVPANTGVMVFSKTGTTTTYYFSAETADVTLPANMLKPAMADGLLDGEDGFRYYKLAYGDNTNKTNLGFYYGAENGAPFNVRKGLAFLAVPVTSEAAPTHFILGGGTDGINSVRSDATTQDVIYNIAGQRVNSTAKPGLYIRNNRKVVVK